MQCDYNKCKKKANCNIQKHKYSLKFYNINSLGYNIYQINFFIFAIGLFLSKIRPFGRSRLT